MTKDFTLPRTGDRPLKFRGKCINNADGECQAGRDQNRWHEINVYRTDGGKYVVQISYHTRWEGELSHDFAQLVTPAPEDPPLSAQAVGEAVAQIFRHYDPVEFVRGYPEGEHYREKQARLIADLHQRYATLVSEVLDGDEFAETIE